MTSTTLKPVTVKAKLPSIPDSPQYFRKASLLVSNSLSPKVGDTALDLSEMHFRFESSQEDEESPNNCMIRVYNLSDDTVKVVQNEYSKVVLQAGYEANYGVIFQGTIRQFRVGRENPTTTYLDILAADGDAAYNYTMCTRSVAAGVTRQERIKSVIKDMNSLGVSEGQLLLDAAGGILPRGKVLFGLAKNIIRDECSSVASTWSIQNGEINIIPLSGYLPTKDVVVLTSETGMIGRPEQTQDGIRVRCLLNPKIVVGGLVKIDNKSINQTLQKAGQGPGAGNAMIPYNQYAGLQQFATVTADGLYRVYVVEFKGDTRGHDWYSELTCLAVNPSTNKVLPYG